MDEGRQDCRECTLLWDGYRTAVHEHFRIEVKLKLAQLSHDAAAINELAPAVERCFEERAALRQRLAAHVTEAHAAVVATAADD